MKLIYIAGPYRAPTAWQVSQNIQRARECAAEVVALGAFPVCPHTMTAHMDGLAPDGYWLAGTLALMLRCDAVLVEGQWLASEGSRLEVAAAETAGIPVFHDPRDIRSWLHGK